MSPVVAETAPILILRPLRTHADLSRTHLLAAMTTEVLLGVIMNRVP